MKPWISINLLMLCYIQVTSSQDLLEICIDEGVAYVEGEAFISTKQDGTSFTCTCLYENCATIRCLRESGPNNYMGAGMKNILPTSVKFAENVEYTEESTKPENVNAVNTGEVNTDFSEPDKYCYDQETRRSYILEDRFVRPADHSTICSCKSIQNRSLPKIVCHSKTCPFPEPPKRYPTNKYNLGCYDYWNDREYRNGAVFIRIRNMDEEGSTFADYRCRCHNSLIRCSARNVPCCNVDTLKYSKIGGRFVTVRAGRRFTCTCLGQNQRYTDCTPIKVDDHHMSRPFVHKKHIKVTGSQADQQMGRSRALCHDVETGRFYRIGDRFLQHRPQSTWLCLCVKIRLAPEVSCRILYL